VSAEARGGFFARANQRAISVDRDTPVYGSVVERVRGLATMERTHARALLLGLGGVLIASSIIGRAGAGTPAIRYGASTFNTLSIMGLAIVVLGRWVRVSPQTFRRVAALSAVLLGFIILTGAAVRLTGSGLGCVDWPTCNDGKIVPAIDDYHGKVEFGNRIVTGLCVFAAGVGVLASLVRVQYRKDLARIGSLVVALIMANAVLGGMTVLNDLQPEYVMGHFLLAIGSLAAGLLLFHRAGEPGDGGDVLGRYRSDVLHGSTAVNLRRALTFSAFLTLLFGTIVTGSGPHGGDPDVERFGIAMTSAVKVHSITAWITLALIVVFAAMLQRATHPQAQLARTRMYVLLLATMLQGGIGYLQWFNQVPAGLVMLHIVGAVAFWSAVLWLRAALTTPRTTTRSFDGRVTPA
jgi:heme a synthase